jgi:hydrogenase nickel incorporation protein HypA/HybF
MHELSIVLSIIDEIGEESEARDLHDVEVVHLKVGTFSGVDPNALLFAWELACEGTPIERSRLDIEIVPLHPLCCVPPGPHAAVALPTLLSGVRDAE